MKALACLLAAACAAPFACAQDGTTTVRLAGTHEQLDNGTRDWRETSLGLQFGFAPRQVLDLSLARTSRFGLRDNQFAASYSMPLSDALTATLEASASDTHRVLARHALGGQLQYEFAKGWLAHGGLRTTSYDSATVNQALASLERYIGAFSVAATWRPTHAYGTTSHGAELRASRYYGERNAVTLILAGGREAASVPGGVSLTGVRSAALTGRHWFDRHWAATWAIGHTRQGNLYSRDGITIGAQYAF